MEVFGDDPNLKKRPKIQVQGLREETNPALKHHGGDIPATSRTPHAYYCLTKKHQERFSVVTGNYYRNSDGHNLGFGGSKRQVANRGLFPEGVETKGGGGGWF